MNAKHVVIVLVVLVSCYGVMGQELVKLGQSNCRFDPMTGVIVYPPLSAVALTQRVDSNSFSMQLEAEDFRAMSSYPHLKWVDLPFGHTDKYPNDDLVGDGCGNVSANASGSWAVIWPGPGRDAITKFVRIPAGGKYRLWVRYQELPDVPASFTLEVYSVKEINVAHKGKLLASKQMGSGQDAVKGLGANIVWNSLQTELPQGLIRIILRKDTDENLPVTLRAIDFVYITDDVNYVPNGIVQLPTKEEIDNRVAGLGIMDAKVAVWRANCWDNISNKSWPKRSDLTNRGSIRACVNEREQILFGLTNPTGDDIEYSLAYEFRGGKAKSLDGAVKLYRLSFTRARRFGWVPDALFEIKDRKFPVSAYHTGWLWIELDTHKLKHGKKTIKIHVSRNKKVIDTIRIDARVLNVRLPEKWTIDAIGWVNPDSEAKVKILSEHGLNIFTGGLRYDFMSRDIMTKYNIKMVLDNTNPPYTKENVANFVESIESTGVDYNDWAVYLEDEPDDRRVHQRVDKAKAMSDADSNIQFFANPSWNKVATIYTFRQLGPYVDLWVPYIGHFEDASALEFVKSTGKPILFYKYDGFFTRNPTMCYNYFRKLPWVAPRYGIDGCGFWAVDGKRQDPWTDMDAPNEDGDGCDPTILYPGVGKNEYVTSRNFEGFREGMEEMKYLSLLDKKLSREAKQALAARMLATTTPAEVESLRNELLNMLLGKRVSR